MDLKNLLRECLLAVPAAVLLLCGCADRPPEEEPPARTIPAVTETTVCETTETATETVTSAAAQTYAAVTEADPSAYQHRNYAAYHQEDEEPFTLPTVLTFRTTVTTTRTTASTAKTAELTARPADESGPGTAASSVSTTAGTTATTVTTTVPRSARVAEMNRLVKSYKRTCSVLLTAEDGTVLYAYQPTKAISGASLIKLPYVCFCCKQLTGGVRSLSDSVTYTKDWYHGGAGVIIKNGTGKSYTVAQLIDYALRYSDNVAYDMLVYLFGTQGFHEMVQQWGYDVSIDKSRFPEVTAEFMCAAMTTVQAAADDGECWRIAWDALVHSKQSYVRDTLGISGMAVKYGSISRQYHETCWIPGEMPCTLVIMSGAVNSVPDVSFVQKAARCAKEIIACYEAELAAQTAETTTTTTTTTTAATAAAVTTTVSEASDTGTAADAENGITDTAPPETGTAAPADGEPPRETETEGASAE